MRLLAITRYVQWRCLYAKEKRWDKVEILWTVIKLCRSRWMCIIRKRLSAEPGWEKVMRYSLFQRISDTPGHLGLCLDGSEVYLPTEQQKTLMDRNEQDLRATQCEDMMSQRL